MGIQIGKGSSIELDIATVYTAIAQCRTLTPPAGDMNLVDTTHLGSTIVTNSPTILDNGTVVFEVLHDSDNATHAQLETNFAAGTECNWKAKAPAPASTIIAFSGPIQSRAWGAVDVRGLWAATYTVKVNTALTITP